LDAVWRNQIVRHQVLYSFVIAQAKKSNRITKQQIRRWDSVCLLIIKQTIDESVPGSDYVA